MRKFLSLLLTTSFLATVAATPAMAREDWHGRPDHHFNAPGPHAEWHGDIRVFHQRDFGHWREGHWNHGFHEGRNGWWWVVGGLWYFYPTPVYPFPDPYVPPTVVVEPAPVAPYAAAPTYVYYCGNPAGYYPYIAQCFAPWQRVASVSAQPVTIVQPTIVAPPQPIPLPAPAPLGQRENDDRQLNAFAVEFQDINLADRHARTSLKNLEQQVEAFRQTLYQRNYNAMDILRDAENLQRRIANQRAKLPRIKKVVVAPPQ